ncbi:MAG TPA: molybdopterin-dependent oxidoreductase, partial [Isosphaeraceae bacterium]|nr:molybdopterin-dependent oxidoreductase [Isosphaeraceae bacterium]
MSQSIDRRRFLEASAALGLSAALVRRQEARGEGPASTDIPGSLPGPSRPMLTKAADFTEVSRGNPRPFRLEGQALEEARLTAETWRLEVVPDDSAQVEHPARLDEGSALDLETLKQIGKRHGIKYLKAMQCNNIPFPLGQGLWEGVPLREVLRRVGKLDNVRRVYYWGFHNNDPKQVFQSSLPLNRALESPPSEPPPIVAYRLNGGDIPLERGGPVRMVVPWAHGFKSIKWLRRIVLTNDYRANDTYALQNNDPESHLK